MKRIFTFLIFFAIGSSAYAAWPIFYVLTPQQVGDLIQTDTCPAGSGMIPLETKVAIHAQSIPSNETWFWKFSGDGRCKKLPEKLHYVDFIQTDYIFPGTITAIYGDKDKGEKLFSFTFHIPGDQYWDCGPLGKEYPPNMIGCAQDM